MEKQNKKGFTIVELVIVIAVIALLVAIIIPTFVSLSEKANVSKDTQLCRMLNEELAVAGAESSTLEFNNYDEVLTYLGNRHIVENLTPTSTGDIVWDANTNRFSLISGNQFLYVGSDATKRNFRANQKNLNLWTIVSSIPNVADQKYSMYLRENANVSSAVVSVGFDAGKNAKLTNLQYVNAGAAQEVIIRTNNFDTNFTVNAPNDNVIHYGPLGSLDIDAVAPTSYHERGNVRIAVLKEGNLEVEAKGSISVVSVSTTTGTSLNVVGDVTTLVAPAGFEATGANAPETTSVSGDLANAVAIINGEAVSSFTNNEITTDAVLLKDNSVDTISVKGNVTISGNLTKFKLNIVSGNININNIYTTYVTINTNYSGKLSFNGGVLDNGGRGTADSDAAVYVKAPCDVSFKDMTIAASLTKGIKASNVKSIEIDNCTFDATNLTIARAGNNSDLQSLSLVDIQQTNNVNNTIITITDSTFKGAPQGATNVPRVISSNGILADSDTGAAIKIKAEGGYSLGAVTITGNTFTDNYRDIVVGTAAYADIFQSTSSRCPAKLCENNKITTWTIADNTTTLTESVVNARAVATLSHNSKTIDGVTYNKYTTDAACCGQINNGVAIWVIANCYTNIDGTWYYVKNGTTYSVSAPSNGSIVLTPVE